MTKRKNLVEQTIIFCGATTHVGKVRKNNQDAFGFNNYLFVVADGMGGHLGGEVASDLAVTTLTNVFELSGKIKKKKTKRNQAGLLQAVEQANNKIIEKASNDASLKGMGTTLCAIMLGTGQDQNPVFLVTNVGDSRIYQLSNGEFNQVTEDHSLVADLVRAGELTPQEAARHPQRNVLTRALGIETNLKADMWELGINNKDKFLLCSDGLFNELNETRIMEILSEVSDPQIAADMLVNESVEAGGHDNVTAMVLTVESTLRNQIKSEPQNIKQDSKIKKEKTNRHKKINWRITGFFITLFALLGIGIGSMWFYAHRGWYVGEHQGKVEIFQGRPEGLLWFEPRIYDIDGPSISTLRELDQTLVLEVIEVSSRQEAEDVVTRLEQRSDG
ncbi:MAG TPA: Stp1/IreP family PP2C-type Ser/Thr phosphatase [Acidimicrobiales bacterium]|nr:Stp1/IreP family PP2C-type Ser/Thr phosphatase [Acidimicrobiales bacterium]